MTLEWVGLLALAAPVQVDGAIAREWRVRAAALAPAEHMHELADGIAADGWRARADALEALARAAALGAELPAELVAAAARALADPHPSVRARAVALHGALGAELDGERAAALAREPLATVRLELARALEHAPASERARLLATLATDEDERVRAAAENALSGLASDEPGVADARLALLAARADPAALARYVLRLASAPRASDAVESDWLASARAAVAERNLAERAIVEALALARGLGGDAELLVRGSLDDADWEPERARLATLAARSGSAELARAVLAALEARADLGGRARQGLLGVLLDAVDPGSELAFLDGAGAETSAAVIAELGMRRDAWDPEAAVSWTDPARSYAVRLALLGAVASAHARSNGPANARVLVQFLASPEPELAARAFEVLCEAGVPDAEVEAALHAAFAALSPDQRRARTGWFSRSAPLHAFRDDWLALGAEPGEARAAACELLAGFTGDAAVRAAVSAWLAEDLELVRACSGTVERPLEQRVQGELRALAGIDPVGTVAELAAALAASYGRSHEIGKIAAASMGRSAAGRADLWEALRSGELAQHERRTRIEACIALARDEDAEVRELAAAELVRDRPGTAWDLRERVLRALAEAGTPSALAELVRLALAPATDAVERLSVAALLGGVAGDPALDALRALARGPFELEPRSVALRALGRRGDDATLGELLERVQAGTLAERGEELAVLRGELVVALGALDPLPDATCAEWLRAPRARAAADLAARFAGDELAASDFAWRHELELARVLARRGAAGACLARDAELARIDGRFLQALGEALADEGEPAAAERALATAEVALAGERDADLGRIARVRARRLALALETGDHARVARLAPLTLTARRAGLIAETPWSRVFGAFDRTARVDPDARVRSARWQACAHAALARGDLAAARSAAGRAERECGLSDAARAAQAELEERLAGAGAR